MSNDDETKYIGVDMNDASSIPFPIAGHMAKALEEVPKRLASAFISEEFDYDKVLDALLAFDRLGMNTSSALATIFAMTTYKAMRSKGLTPDDRSEVSKLVREIRESLSEQAALRLLSGLKPELFNAWRSSTKEYPGHLEAFHYAMVEAAGSVYETYEKLGRHETQDPADDFRSVRGRHDVDPTRN